LNGFTSHRIATPAGASLDDLERSESDDVNFLTTQQLSLDDCENQVDDPLRFLIGDTAVPVIDSASQICLRHSASFTDRLSSQFGLNWSAGTDSEYWNSHAEHRVV
jgi:hypothetical protein